MLFLIFRPFSRLSLLLALLLLPILLPIRQGIAVTTDWEKALPGWVYEFPRDHGPHDHFKTEWWYATGNLKDAEGQEYGFQLTFFREGILPHGKPQGSSRFRVTELPFAHFAFTDVTSHTFRSYQITSRGAFGEAGFSIPPGRVAWINDWSLAMNERGELKLKASSPGQDNAREISLTLFGERSPLIHGKDGISNKSSKPGHASHYYSLSHLKATGSVIVDGKVHPVSGLVWFDHEWATNQLEQGDSGWDWSGLHLSSGDDLMIFQIRDSSGKPSFLTGTLRDPEGMVKTINDLSMVPHVAWKSPHTGGLYPSSWDVKIPSQKLELTLTPKLSDQELLLSPFAYWEGAVRGAGLKSGQQLTAEGYLEMTGYGGRILGLGE